ncbi:MAG: prolipoprotein diacylglyceryl transferase [Rickettsiaceae bacterium]|nr:prolipoprotein diacylglyceryl transferase [Rickettsiaceae bacterium]MDP4832640.1 prolipoprotein diacylglyceryl transferase [Rickettsiaceae bacterium]
MNFPNIDPVIISLGPLAVSWYSLSYVVGIMLGWFYILKLISRDTNNDINKKHIEDFITWIIIGVIIGGRLGYVLFYDPVKYFSNPIEILKTYQGGMSFHGGTIGYITASALFARRNNISFLGLTDLSAAATPIALFLGRLANFINAELYGRVTDVPWAFIFPGSDYQPRHPSQLYEAALEGFVLFCILFVVAIKYRGLSKRGLLSGLFLILYTIFRIIIEFFREPDVQIGFFAGSFTMGQLLSIPMLVAGIFLIYYSRTNANRL